MAGASQQSGLARHQFLMISSNLSETYHEILGQMDFGNSIVFTSLCCETEKGKRAFEKVGEMPKDNELFSRSVDYLSKPRKYIGLADIDEWFDKSGYSYLHVVISLTTHEKIFDSPQKKSSASEPPVAVLNVVFKRGRHLECKVAISRLHFLLNQAYFDKVYSSYYSVAYKAEKSLVGVPTFEQFEDYLIDCNRVNPDVAVMVWGYEDIEEYQCLTCEAASVESLNFDFEDKEGPAWRVFSTGVAFSLTDLDAQYVAKLGSEEWRFRATVYSLGYRSAEFHAFPVGGKNGGVVAFLRRKKGKFPKAHWIFVSAILRECTRHFLEQNHVQRIDHLRGTMNRQMPLLAIGVEASQRFHDVKDQVNGLRAQISSMAEVAQDCSSPGRVNGRKDRCNEILDDMRETLTKQLSTFQTSREKVRSIDLVQWIQELEPKFRIACDELGAEFSLGFPESKIICKVQRYYLERAIFNLITNAAYFAALSAAEDGDGKVTMSVGQTGGFVEISVADNGRGVPSSIEATIFEQGVTTRKSGYGIGLSIVRSVMEDHGGNVSFINTQAGGAKFRLKLPLSKT